MEKPAELLFNYLRDILYHPDRAALDVSALPPDFQKLGQGMQFLADCVREERTFSRAMARGDLSLEPPGGDNVLAAPMKELQASLRHLAWQTQQVAKGDYSQQVDFMGEFSQAFNTMTGQLKERTERLLAEKQLVEEKNLELSRNLELVMALTNYTHNMIFVFSREKGRQIFVNRPAEWFLEANPRYASQLVKQLTTRQREQLAESETWEIEMESQDGAGSMFYRVESFPISWWKAGREDPERGEERAVVHIVGDDTERRKRENLIYRMAYLDPLTGLNNRRYAMDQMKRWAEEGTPFVLTFVDVDHLKYCNDTFGHESGDQYLIDVSRALNALGGVLCRVGGDEFFLLQTGISPEEQDARLSRLRELMMQCDGYPYPRSFSFASCQVPAGPDICLEDYIKQADTRMYLYKKAKKYALEQLPGSEKE